MKTSDNPFSVEKPEDSSGFLLWQVTNLWQREIKKALLEFNLTHSQFVLMASMYWHKIHDIDVTQIELSTHTKIDPMTTSTVLRTLQKKGFLERNEHHKDTRAKTVTLTINGVEIVKKAIVVVENFDRKFFSILSEKTSGFNLNLIELLKQKIV
jgi:MarR family transcriptional regulator, organic hydroperoxide resistance regulator